MPTCLSVRPNGASSRHFSQKFSRFLPQRLLWELPRGSSELRTEAKLSLRRHLFISSTVFPFWPLSSHLSLSLLSLLRIMLSVRRRNGLFSNPGFNWACRSTLTSSSFFQPTWQRQPGASSTSWATCLICSCGLATTCWATARRFRPASSPT